MSKFLESLIFLYCAFKSLSLLSYGTVLDTFGNFLLFLICTAIAVFILTKKKKPVSIDKFYNKNIYNDNGINIIERDMLTNRVKEKLNALGYNVTGLNETADDVVFAKALNNYPLVMHPTDFEVIEFFIKNKYTTNSNTFSLEYSIEDLQNFRRKLRCDVEKELKELGYNVTIHEPGDTINEITDDDKLLSDSLFIYKLIECPTKEDIIKHFIRYKL